jgi:dolichol-phosphate mannosyltransferase
VVVPTYNEKENIAPLVDALEGAGIPGLSVLFVDDNSPDGTADEVRRVSQTRPWVKILVRQGVRGFSSAYQDGLAEALKQLGPEVLLGMDADLQHPPSAIPALVGAIQGGADLAVASRYVPGGGIMGWSRGRRIISRGANAYARWLLRVPVRDATSGFKAYTSKSAESVAKANLHAKRFEFQVATLKLLKGSRIVEVPYVFVARKAGQSKFGALDIPRFLFSVARMALD